MNKPPILNFACLRNAASQEKPFFYDNSSNLNLIEINGCTMPFVDTPTTSIPELDTKTRIDRETDEGSMRLVEFLTKTFVEREDDDEDNSRFLELMTKTKMLRESDDENDITYYK